MSTRVIVTAGGTTESIDAVRTMEITETSGCREGELRTLSHIEVLNISKGRFPLEIARSLARRSSADQPIEVVLIGKEELIREVQRDGNKASLTLVPFRSFADLSKAIDSELRKAPVDMLVMAAAVSDYSPVAVEGKISSAEDELIIRLRKNPKLLDSLRDKLGDQAVLVGFKLLAGVSPETLTQVAVEQSRRAGCDLSVANDARLIDWTNGWHPVTVVAPKGHLWDFAAARPQVAERLAEEFLTCLREKRSTHPVL